MARQLLRRSIAHLFNSDFGSAPFDTGTQEQTQPTGRRIDLPRDCIDVSNRRCYARPSLTLSSIIAGGRGERNRARRGGRPGTIRLERLQIIGEWAGVFARAKTVLGLTGTIQNHPEKVALR